MNSKAYRAISSSQSKKYFARSKNWSGGQGSSSAFLPATKKPIDLPVKQIRKKKSP
jgi:hypothetical protein